MPAVTDLLRAMESEPSYSHICAAGLEIAGHASIGGTIDLSNLRKPSGTACPRCGRLNLSPTAETCRGCGAPRKETPK